MLGLGKKSLLNCARHRLSKLFSNRVPARRLCLLQSRQLIPHTRTGTALLTHNGSICRLRLPTDKLFRCAHYHAQIYGAIYKPSRHSMTKSCPQHLTYNQCSPRAPSCSPLIFLRRALHNPPNCGFHTTSRRDVLPIIWLFIKPVAKIGAILSGRGFRKWWQALPAKKRAYFYEQLKNSWHKILATIVAIAGLAYLNYVLHLQETPLTKRKRYIAFTQEQFMKIAQFEADQLVKQFEGSYLERTHPYCKQVLRVTNALVDRNQDLDIVKNQKWAVSVIKSEDRNAFVLPTGNIFVFSGLLETTQNDDQLAIVLGHELAHVVLGHGAEQVSFAQLIDWMIVVVMSVIWALMPNDGIALVTQWFYGKVVDLLLNMPYSRKLETEADQVGMEICAKACFDVREGVSFWALMDSLSKLEDTEVPEWLSTHPSNDKRIELLDLLIPKALETRDICQCPRLPRLDPRSRIKGPSLKIEDLEKVAKEKRLLAEQGVNLNVIKTVPSAG